MDPDDRTVGDCLRGALKDLDELGLLDGGEYMRYFTPTQQGRKFPAASLNSAWRQIFEIHLAKRNRNPHQLANPHRNPQRFARRPDLRRKDQIRHERNH